MYIFSKFLIVIFTFILFLIYYQGNKAEASRWTWQTAHAQAGVFEVFASIEQKICFKQIISKQTLYST